MKSSTDLFGDVGWPCNTHPRDLPAPVRGIDASARWGLGDAGFAGLTLDQDSLHRLVTPGLRLNEVVMNACAGLIVRRWWKQSQLVFPTQHVRRLQDGWRDDQLWRLFEREVFPQVGPVYDAYCTVLTSAVRI